MDRELGSCVAKCRLCRLQTRGNVSNSKFLLYTVAAVSAVSCLSARGKCNKAFRQRELFLYDYTSYGVSHGRLISQLHFSEKSLTVDPQFPVRFTQQY